MASIDIQSVRKSYGEHAVLHGVDLEIKDGEFIVLVAPVRLWQVHASAHDRRA